MIYLTASHICANSGAHMRRRKFQFVDVHMLQQMTIALSAKMTWNLLYAMLCKLAPHARVLLHTYSLFLSLRSPN